MRGNLLGCYTSIRSFIWCFYERCLMGCENINVGYVECNHCWLCYLFSLNVLLLVCRCVNVE